MGLIDARDVHYYGGTVLLAAGAGLRWGYEVGLMVAGFALVAAVAPLVWRPRRGNP